MSYFSVVTLEFWREMMSVVGWLIFLAIDLGFGSLLRQKSTIWCCMVAQSVMLAVELPVLGVLLVEPRLRLTIALVLIRRWIEWD